MPDRTVVLFAGALLATAHANADAGSPCGVPTEGEVQGVWRLVEASTRQADGTIEYPFGNPAAGLFIYSPGGHLSLHLHRNPPPPRFESRPDNEELGATARGYIGYYGTWSLDGSTLVHHIEGAMLPNRIGQNAERPVAVCDDVLELRIEAGDGRLFYRRLERIERLASGTADDE